MHVFNTQNMFPGPSDFWSRSIPPSQMACAPFQALAIFKLLASSECADVCCRFSVEYDLGDKIRFVIAHFKLTSTQFSSQIGNAGKVAAYPPAYLRW